MFIGMVRCCFFFSNAGYTYSGFLALQLAIDRAIIAHSNTASNEASNDAAASGNFSLRLQRHPYPPYDRDRLVVVLGRYLGYYVLLSLLVIAPCIVKDVVVEKENKLKVWGRSQQAVGGAPSRMS